MWIHRVNTVLFDFCQLTPRRVSFGTSESTGVRSMRVVAGGSGFGGQIGVFGLSDCKTLHSHRREENG
jgi:hypothetical protein